ncbi:urease accessory protein UreF [Salinisphaera sp. Q1T1-3]|uniref:urease accessory protein UreF n=1 Tax=Salinisphaera sp. Q1T1-3 TaxID=2321229 RepID=UPI000E76D3D8|nr:urease accessory UreF family protein [Salinisphaera sp. Q1T1-3]RJS94259.1 urease accessory protein UreF [Salinisphaera sp. Q1T1-3]
MMDRGLQRLLQLASPSLPVGAFAYSEGLEAAVATSTVTDAETLSDWLSAAFEHCVVPLDLAVALRLHEKWQSHDLDGVCRWSRFVLASRETAERRAQERHLGHALASLLDGMSLPEAAPWRLGGGHAADVSFPALWMLAAVRWNVPAAPAVEAMAWAWLENQVLAAVKLIPLGQTAGQRLLFELAGDVPAGAARAAELTDDALGGSLPGVTMACCDHEILYSRLYRS